LREMLVVQRTFMGIWVFRMIETSQFDKRFLSLKSTTYLGYYYRHDLSELVKSLTDNPGTDVMSNLQRHTETPAYKEIHSLWESSKFNKDSMQWINYYPSKDYSQELVDDISFYLRLNGVHRSWISRVDPGNFAPWHWDVDDNEQEYLMKGEIKRYSITLCEPTMGHIFIVGEDYLYNAPQGSIFKWNNHREWHTGINAGMTPKFTFHILGY
jgi:hypothetical protein